MMYLYAVQWCQLAYLYVACAKHTTNKDSDFLLKDVEIGLFCTLAEALISDSDLLKTREPAGDIERFLKRLFGVC